MTKPTMAQLTRSIGSEAVMLNVAAIVEVGMQGFGAQRRMPAGQIAMFAEEIADGYPHETLADINVFMRGCAMGKYDDGEFYNSVDIPRLSKWWSKYLASKAEVWEIERKREEVVHDQGLRDLIGGMGGLKDAVKAFTMEERERKKAEDKIARMKQLERHLPQMSDDELRDSWPLYPSSEERSMILQEANRRGLVQEKIEDHLKSKEE